MHEHETDFDGGAFHPSLDDGRAGARITLLADRMQVVCNGGKQFTMHYADLRLELGGASGRMLFLRGKTPELTVHCEAKGFPEALRRESGGRCDGELDRVLGAKRSTKHTAFTWWFAGLAALIAVGWGVWLLLGLGFQAAVRGMPTSADRKLGDAAESSMQADRYDDAQITAALTAMVDRLKPHAALELEWRVHLQRENQINAFCLPGGSITFLTGLIAKADSAEQVAGVMAHEMAHATKRHGLQQVMRSVGVIAAAQLLLGDATGVIAIAAQGATLAVLTGYSRDMEREADAEGARMLAAAGIDPAGMIGFFKLMEQVERERGRDPASGAEDWFSSHPATAERIANLEELIPTLPRGEAKPLAIDWPAIRAAAAAAHGPGSGPATAAPVP